MQVNADVKATHLPVCHDQTTKRVVAATGQVQLAFLDIVNSMKAWRIWLLLAYQDIKLRYRRSVLGPLWITLSMAITVYTMGLLYGHLFRTNLEQYYPFLVTGMLAWAFIATVVTEQAEAFTGAENFIKQINLPYAVHIHRIIVRNVIIFFYNMLVMLPIYIIFRHSLTLNWCALLLLPGLLLLYVNAFSYGLILAMICARFRDVSQLIKSLMQVVFFLTPVMWNPAVLPHDKQFLISLNPFYIFLELIREPLLGAVPSLLHVVIVCVITVLGIFIAAGFFVPYRSRIVYWL